MSKNVTIKSEVLTVVISTMGAELQSVKYDGKERIWQGDPAFWSGRAPILFPVCGSLRDKKYVYGGKEYSLPQHGFARHSEFNIESVSKNKATFSLKSSEETKSCYPFDFTLFVIYEVVKNRLEVTYKIQNDGNAGMWAFIGSHESYLTDMPLSAYDLVFEKAERFLSRICEDALVSDKYDDFGSGKILQINEELFKRFTAVFTGINSRKVTLRKNGTPIATLSFDAENLLMWTMKGSNYICLEPWLNYPDPTDSDYDILKKPGIMIIEAGKSYLNKHSIEYFAE